MPVFFRVWLEVAVAVVMCGKKRKNAVQSSTSSVLSQTPMNGINAFRRFFSCKKNKKRTCKALIFLPMPVQGGRKFEGHRALSPKGRKRYSDAAG
jgi:hypothetical protein